MPSEIRGSDNFDSATVNNVVSASKTDTFSTTSTSFVDVTGMSVTITPSSTASKVYVEFSTQVSNSTANWIVFLRLTRNGTPIFVGDAAGSRIQSSSGLMPRSTEQEQTAVGFYLDSPTSTSAQTYKLQMKVQGQTGYLNRTAADADAAHAARTASTITATEIGG